MEPFRKLAIIGLGLIGSSIAHAARRGGLATEIAGFDASADVRSAPPRSVSATASLTISPPR